MTRVLDEPLWSQFKDEEGRGRGRRFEELAGRLLEILYGGDWQKTKPSHDGGRDFELCSNYEFLRRGKDGKAWAECKMHSKAIALKTIGNTLVMALLEDVHKLILISYSHLSRDCALQVARFARKRNCSIDVYAEETLDNILLTYKKDLLSEYLDADVLASLPSPPTISETEVDFHVDFAPDVISLVESNKADVDESHSPLLHPGQEFVVEVSVYNKSITESVRAIINIPSSDSFELIPRKGQSRKKDGTLAIEYPVNHQQFLLERFRFLVKDRIGHQHLPNISICSGPHSTEKSLGAFPVEISPIHFIQSLVGDARDELEKAETFIKSRPSLKCLIVDGRSGVGKTRFLSELSAKLWGLDYDLIRLDLESFAGGLSEGEDSLMLRHVLAHVYSLPLLGNMQAKASRVRNALLNQASEGWIERFLYHRMNIDTKEDVEQCAKLIVAGLAERKMAFVLDNAQYISQNEERVFREMARLASHGKGEGAWVLCFNIDKFFGDTPGSKLYQTSLQTATRAGDGRQSFWKRITLTDFEGEQVYTFLNAALPPRNGSTSQFTKDFPKTSEEIRKRSSPRPLYLWHMILALHQKGILSRDGSRFIPTRAGEFIDAIRQLPTDTRQLLEIRWKNALEVNDEVAFKRIASVVGLFSQVPYWLLRELDVSADQITEMENLGFISRQPSRDLAPGHQEIFGLFSEIDIESSLAERIIDILEKRNPDRYFIQYFLCKDLLSRLDIKLFDRAMDALRKGWLNFSDPRGDEFLRRLIDRLIEWDADEKDRGAKATTLRLAINTLSGITGYESFGPSLDLVLKHAQGNSEEYHNFGIEAFNLVHSLVNNSFARNSYSRPFQLMKAYVNKVDQFYFLSEIDRALRLGALINRLGVSAMWLAKKDEAFSCEARARDIAAMALEHPDATTSQRSEAKRLIIEAEIDLGNVFEFLGKNKEDMFRHWENAVDWFDQLDKGDGDIRSMVLGMVSFYRARTHIEKREWEKAESTLSSAIAQCASNHNSYHGIRSTILRAILKLLAEEAGASEAVLGIPPINLLLNQALDWTISAGVGHAEWGLHLIFSELEALGGESAYAANMAEEGVAAFLKTKPDEAMIRLRLPYLAALFILIRKCIIKDTEQNAAERTMKFDSFASELSRELSFSTLSERITKCASDDELTSLLEEVTASTQYRYCGYPLLAQ